MRSLTAIVLTLFTLTVILTVGTVVAGPSDENGSISDTETYSISYRLNGGEFTSTPPDSYVSGATMTLPIPTKDGYWFAGWCTESGLTNPIGGILGNIRGHVTLYAKWIEDDREGLGWEMTVEGSYRNGSIPHTVTGTIVGGYDAIIDGDVLLRSEKDVLISWPGGDSHDTTVKSTWIGRITDGWVYEGNITVDKERLTVWSSGDTRMYLRDMMIPVKMETEIGKDGKITYELTSTFTYRVDPRYEPIISCEYPITVSGKEQGIIGEDLTLTAEGEHFDGWYVNGKRVSSEHTFTFVRPSPTDRYEARTTSPYIVVLKGSDVNSMGFLGAIFTDDLGNRISGISNLDPGLYHGTITKDGVENTIDFLVDGTRAFSFEWEFDGQSYEYSSTVSYNEIYSHIHGNSDLIRSNMSSQDQIDAFHTPDDPALIGLHSYLVSCGESMDRSEFASFVLTFVQSIPYVEDIVSRDDDEFWKLPSETLWDGNGDCEDKTFLYGTLMGMSGYRVAFLMFKDHAMSAISIDTTGYIKTIEGYEFALCETILLGYTIGMTTAGHLPEDAIFSCRVESFRS